VNGKPVAPGSSSATWTLERTFGTGDGNSLITDRANSLAFSPDGKTLAIGSGEPSRSGDITLWDMATGKLTTNYAERHLDSVFALDFSPDGKLLASGGADKAVRITDLSTGKVVKVFEGHTHHVLGVSWRADGRLLASSGADNVVKVWDWTTGDRRKSVDGWDKEVTGIHYLGAADQIATSAGDNKLRLITSDGGEVKQRPGSTAFLQSLATTKSGDVVLGGDQDGNVREWDVATAKEIAVFKP
jgi:WD40 repeat protein